MVTFTMKRILLFFTVLSLCLAVPSGAFSQNITVSSAVGMSVDTLLQRVLAGDGVAMSGDPNEDFGLSPARFNNNVGNITRPQIGTFHKGGSNFPFESGIIMTTGNISVAPGPNLLDGASVHVDGTEYVDSYLVPLATNTVIDGAALDFDFIAFSDTFAFNYIFASEEYPEYVCSSYNDIFAFFLEGTDPVTLAPVKRNVAIIPNTVTAQHPNGIPVTINSVNNGGHSVDVASGCYPYYQQYFNDSPSGVEYDGSTTVLSAGAYILACQNYRMHLAIANVGDNNWDSGVFLEAGSFYSPQLSVEPTLDSAILHHDGGAADTLIQNCSKGGLNMVFSLPIAPKSGYDISMHFGGSAVYGVDYVAVKDSLHGGDTLSALNPTFSFQAGLLPDGYLDLEDDSIAVRFSILPDADFGDSVTKTVEAYITITLCSGFDVKKYDTLHFVLKRNDSIRLREHLSDTLLTFCRKCDRVTATFDEPSKSPLLYRWIAPAGAVIESPDSLSSAADITETVRLKFVARDPYGCQYDTADIKVVVNPMPEIGDYSITPDHGCVPLPVSCRVNGASGDFDYMWVASRGQTPIDTVRAAAGSFEFGEPGYYDLSLWASSASDCYDSLRVKNAVHVSAYPQASFTYEPEEPQNGREVVFTNTSHGEDIESSNWYFGDGGHSTEENPAHEYNLPSNDNMTVRLQVENADGCADDTSMVLSVNDNFAFWVPNSFSPNNDGLNDVFLPAVKDVASYRLLVFNRTGQTVFASDDVAQGWDGTADGKDVPAGVYVWRIEYVRYSNKSLSLVKTGQVILLR